MQKVFIRQGILAQFIEPFSLSFVSLADTMTCDNGIYPNIYDSNIFSRRKSKSARSRSRLSSFADWNPAPSVQSILQQFNFSAPSCGDMNQNTYYSNLNHHYPGGSNLSSHSNDNTLSRHCFLFTNYLLLCVRTKDGKLQLLEVSVQDSKDLDDIPLLSSLEATEQERQK